MCVCVCVCLWGGGGYRMLTVVSLIFIVDCLMLNRKLVHPSIHENAQIWLSTSNKICTSSVSIVHL